MPFPASTANATETNSAKISSVDLKQERYVVRMTVSALTNSKFLSVICMIHFRACAGSFLCLQEAYVPPGPVHDVADVTPGVGDTEETVPDADHGVHR